MQVFCPNCGHANEARDDGGKVMCTACTSVFEAPVAGARPPPPPPPPAASNTPAGWAPPPPPPTGYAPPPPPPGVGGSWSQVSAGPLTPAAPGAMPAYNPLAVASLVCGVLCCIPPLPLVSIGLGVKALQQLNAPQNVAKGRELAIVGIVLGALGVSSWFLSFLGALID